MNLIEPHPILMHVDHDEVGAARLKNAVTSLDERVVFDHYTSGPAALGRLMTTTDAGEVYKPTLITMDIGVDEGGGLEFIVSLREVLAFARIPLLVMYSGTQNQDLIQAYQLGVSGCTPKPIDNMRWIGLGNEINKLYLEEAYRSDNPLLDALYKSRPAMAAAQKA